MLRAHCSVCHPDDLCATGTARYGPRLPRSAFCSLLSVEKWGDRDGIVKLSMDVLISRARLSASPYSLLSEDGKPHLHFVIQEDPPA